MAGVHDAQMDFDGNIWITYSHASKATTIAPRSTPRPAR